MSDFIQTPLREGSSRDGEAPIGQGVADQKTSPSAPFKGGITALSWTRDIKERNRVEKDFPICYKGLGLYPSYNYRISSKSKWELMERENSGFAGDYCLSGDSGLSDLLLLGQPPLLE